MHWFAILIAAALVLFVLDRLALWMKERGRLEHRKSPERPAGGRDDSGDPPGSGKEREEG